MTKKNYIAAANLIRTSDYSKAVREQVIKTFVEFFKSDDPRFDEDRFRAAATPVAE